MLRDLIEKRQSCRSYDSEREVPIELIRECLEDARLSPSACNSQPWEFTICTGEKAKKIPDTLQLAGQNKFCYDVNSFIVVSEGPFKVPSVISTVAKKQDYQSIDIGIATAYLTLSATEKGLSTCIIGLFEEEKLQEIISSTANIRLVIALGYAKSDDIIRDKRRKAFDVIVKE